MKEIIHVFVEDRDSDFVHDLEVPTDIQLNMMEVCRSYELPVEGTCGGMALCASCHMYIMSDHALSEPTEDEEDMLDQAFFVKPNSRLGCQIRINEDLDGLCVKLAPVGEV